MPSAEEKFLRGQTARWLLKLIDAGINLNDYFFECAGWAMGDIRQLAERISREVKAPTGRTRAATMARSDLKDLLDRHTRLDDALESVYNHECMQGQIRVLVTGYLEEVARRAGRITDQKIYKRLRSLFGLNAKAGELCIFAFSIGQYSRLEYFFEDSLELLRHGNRSLLGNMLNMSAAALSDIRCALEGMGILESGHNSMRLTDSVEYALMVEKSENLQSLFCRPLARAALGIEEFHICDEDKEHALAVMGAKSGRPAHLLLYGAPGSGKTSFAAALASELGVKAWAAECGTKDDIQDRRASLTACLKISLQNPGSFVLVDEAENLLDTDARDVREGSAKAWVNELLERPDTRIVWITNRIDHLDPAVRRRFSYSIHFREPGRKESLSMWNAVARRLNAESFLPLEARERFARQYKVPVATMEMAIAQARELASEANFMAWVERVLKAQVTLQNNGVLRNPRQQSKSVFDSEAICVSTPAGQFLDKAKYLARQMEEAPEPGLGTMLFYGPPGTGKTELARHLAKLLEKELIIQRASDLLGPYVGMTEQQIAAAFARAEADKALLLIDEADSFIFGREGAHHSWETTMVNEFLIQLESYTGLCICTTNFRKWLDPAAMRRFTLKLEFGYARPEQLKRLYARILQPLVGTEPDQDILDNLCRHKCLTPGDFKSVRQKMWIEDKPTHSLLLRALAHEEKLKLENGSRNLGF